ASQRGKLCDPSKEDIDSASVAVDTTLPAGNRPTALGSSIPHSSPGSSDSGCPAPTRPARNSRRSSTCSPAAKSAR
ncbi:unnamed protein product, partial [Pylaiella littoralis]